MLVAGRMQKHWMPAKPKSAKLRVYTRLLLTLPDLARFSNQVGAPLDAMLWKPIPIMPSDPLVAKIELV
jgi:hypothetical protein